MLKKNASSLLLNQSDRDKMRSAGQANAALMDHLRPHVVAGITTQQIDDLVVEWTRQHGHRAATLGYQGFSRSCCTSINEVICHGIPGDEVLCDGDILNVDITTIADGWYGDQSETFLIGQVSEEKLAVTQCAFDCLWAAIGAITPGCAVSVIGEAVIEIAHARGFSIVREYIGHGLGRSFHQDPSIPHYPNRQSRTDRLMPGMTFTIEPMINAGTRFTTLDRKDGWTVRTKDGQPSAQFEHTMLMTENGPEVLTGTRLGPQQGHVFTNPA